MKLVLRIGGSVLGSPPSTGLLQAYSRVLEDLRGRGHKLVVVVGGGELSRRFIKIGEEVGLGRDDRDELAILVSRLNAMLLAKMVMNAPHIIPKSIAIVKRMFKEKGVMVMGGLKPGMTTDTVASKVSKSIGAQLLVKASDQDGIYTSDPKLDPKAKRLDRIRFKDLQTLLGGNHEPGIHRILDPVSINILRGMKIKVVVVNGFNPKNVISAVEGKSLGTTVE